MSRCLIAAIILLALLAGCNSTETVQTVQPSPVVIVPPIEPQEQEPDDDPHYVAPKGMTRAEVYAMLEERSQATNDALEAKERQKRQARRRPRLDRVNIHLGSPVYWHHGYYGPYYYDHCWPWHGRHWHGHRWHGHGHGHFGISLRTW